MVDPVVRKSVHLHSRYMLRQHGSTTTTRIYPSISAAAGAAISLSLSLSVSPLREINSLRPGEIRCKLAQSVKALERHRAAACNPDRIKRRRSFFHLPALLHAVLHWGVALTLGS